ncbi:PAS domain-containing protein [Oculatella sp. LEGE 06141]|uniref:PAS domain-containing protein n=1 Tax=Oculatella sp. LEGE 06141 TaxID=1828648 RepID=UPI0018816B1F|nr:PAS domain-containing protein [Oculatella sp. LEGE 06141]MBE9180340.1 PAS domain-containing protein [Oculatella sp. LEGE 06141]
MSAQQSGQNERLHPYCMNESMSPGSLQLVSPVIQPALVVAFNTPAFEVIRQMHQSQMACVLVVEQQRLVGLFTEADLVRAIATGTELTNLTIAAVMATQVISLSETEAEDICTVLRHFQAAHISHLPILNSCGYPVGMVTQASILQALDPGTAPIAPSWPHSAAEEAESSPQVGTKTIPDQNRYQAIVASHTAYIAKLSAILNSTIASTVRFRVFANQDWEYEYQSVGCETLFGYTAAEILANKMLWISRVFPADRDTVIMPLFADIFAGRTATVDYRFQHKDGSLRWISGTYISCWDDSAKNWLVTGVSTDISDAKGNEAKRQQAEAALRESEEQRRLALDLSEIGMWDWQITIDKEVWSDQHFRLLGLEPGAIETNQQAWFNCIHPDDQIYVQQVLAASHHHHAAIEVEYRVVYPDGSFHWRLSKGQYIYNESGQAIRAVGIIMDINDRKRAEEQITQAELQYRMLVEQIPGVVYTAPLTDTPQFSYISPNLLHLLNVPADEWIPGTFNSWAEYVHPDDRDRVLQVLNAQLAANEPIQAEYRMLTRDNRTIWVRDCARRVLAIDRKTWVLQGIVFDISERKQAEAALRQSEARYLAILQDQTDLIIRFLPDGTLTFVNEAFCRYFGLARAEVIGQCYEPSVLEEDREWVAQQLQTIHPDNPVVCIENRVIAQGQIRWTQWVNRGIFDEQGQKVELQGVGRDISDRKRVEEELARAKAAAEAANKAKSIFLANMSHELRTPLNAILGFANLMSRASLLPPSQQEQLDIINRNGEYLLQLINDVLSISKIEAGQLTLEESNVDLYALLDSLETTFRFRAEAKGLQWIYEGGSHCVCAEGRTGIPQYVQIDERKLRQIITNLVDNAIKFTEQGHVILRVAVKATPELESEPGCSAAASPHLLCFEVEDTGPGIASDDLNTLFDAFVQAESGRKSNQGAGLGLAICHRFVRLMGGAIAIDNRRKTGTVFQVSLPLKRLQTDALQPVPLLKRRVGLAPDQPTYRILVADDVEENRQLLVARLQLIGLDVRAAKNGQEAVDLWNSYWPHLIWMDIRMPIMDGFEATRHIRAMEQARQAGQKSVERQPPLTKIIAITASVFEEERQRILTAGCDDCVSKPCSEDIFFDKMSQHLGVRYRYDAVSSAIAQPALISQAQLLEALSTMPPEWVAAVNCAARRVREREIVQLLEQVPESQASLKLAILTLVNEFELEQLIHLTQP